eukprot:GHVS01084736.1.p1 GENE.GHVS01084736.1~~GHVS01084736.1.p1  ORF type:complete len:159 (+),score=23.21 GHVS01084736.1:67-477(+)
MLLRSIYLLSASSSSSSSCFSSLSLSPEITSSLSCIPKWKFIQPSTTSSSSPALSVTTVPHLHRRFVFTDFNETFGFMARVAMQAERLGHHPNWQNVYNQLEVSLSTHDAGGVTMKDIEMAKFMDAAADKILLAKQ